MLHLATSLVSLTPSFYVVHLYYYQKRGGLQYLDSKLGHIALLVCNNLTPLNDILYNVPANFITITQSLLALVGF